MEKKKLIVDYHKITSDLKEEIFKKYPLGWINHKIKVMIPGNSFFYAITIDTSDASYLVKVPARIDSKQHRDINEMVSDSHSYSEMEEEEGVESQQEKEKDSE